VHRQLLVPHTATPDDTAFWFNFDWPKALQAGATATGQPYSGQHDFVKTEMLWPITHMVAPANQAVACASCHSSAAQSRLGDLPGVYLPGRDHNSWVDRLGWLAVLGAIGGVAVHALARIVTRRRKTTGAH
jgi:Cytochrome c bacterial